MADSQTDRQADRPTDSDAGQWMSYAQLAEIRGITKKAAQRLTLRHRWRRQPANDGGVLVWVPEDAAAPGRQAGGQPDRHDAGSDGLAAGALAALETAVLSLTERALAAERRADSAEAAIAGERARADALRERIDELQAGQGLMMDTHARALAAAQDQLERVREAAEHQRQAEVERRARGLVARLRQAWRGE